MNLVNHPAQVRSSARKQQPNGRSKRTRDRAGKQEALIHSALKLFAAKGYEITTTREIAAAAKCAEGLIHRYFKGKAGLLTALVEDHFSKEFVELSHDLQPGHDLQAEYIQLVLWEVDRFWSSRDFLKIFIPRAFVDPTLAGVMEHAVISSRVKIILQRLKRYSGCLKLPAEEIEALAQTVGILGLVFGFMRPLVLGQDRVRAKQMARRVAKMLVRGLVSPAADRIS
jgi:TetR/AcrR family transcriptional regulator, regulator of cefoperazone and chloramphenicol sensitivity